MNLFGSEQEILGFLVRESVRFEWLAEGSGLDIGMIELKTYSGLE